MTPAHRRYLLLEAFLGAAIVNALINGAIGWLQTRQTPLFPTWKVPGVAIDLAGTAFGVTFGTCLVMPLQIRRKLAKGKLTPLPLSPRLARLAALLPPRTWRRALRLGLLSVPIFAAPVVIALGVLGVSSFARQPYVIFKAVFAAVQGAIVTPFIVRLQLAGAVPPAPLTSSST